MFTPKIVGVANGTPAGWGNLGGGATQLIMPVLFTIIKKAGCPDFQAWRIAFLIPGCMHILVGLLCLQFSQVRTLNSTTRNPISLLVSVCHRTRLTLLS
jgi:NNP family nitrate/nitrite transporter-like MFS transporter